MPFEFSKRRYGKLFDENDMTGNPHNLENVKEFEKIQFDQSEQFVVG
jgi:hypothetical protein